MSSPKTYTANDIERYHRGEMTAAEMHELEKTALDDPMLADALEGYRNTSTASTDLQALQNRLQQRTEEKEKKEAKIFFLKNPWLRIAALFVLIAGGGWLVLQTFSSEEANLATSDMKETESGIKTMAADSAPAAPALPPAMFSTDSLQQHEVMAAETKRSNPSLPKVGTTPAAPPIRSNAGIKEKNDLSQAEPDNKTTATGIATLKSSVPANTNREAADTGRLLETAQQQNAERFNDIAANKQMQTARAKRVVAEMAEPVGGWPAFEKYIAENKKSVATDGAVELQFEVDKNGQPVDITVTKPRCEACDAEAIRLLKEGPKWRGKSGKVRIQL